MFGKPSKSARLNELEDVVDDLVHEVFCDLNPMSVKKRLHRLEDFKGEMYNWQEMEERNKEIRKANFKEAEEGIEELYDLQERLGQKVKDNDMGAKETLLALFKYFGLTLNEEGEVIKIKATTKVEAKNKNAKSKVVPTPKKTNRRKTK